MSKIKKKKKNKNTVNLSVDKGWQFFIGVSADWYSHYQGVVDPQEAEIKPPTGSTYTTLGLILLSTSTGYMLFQLLCSQ